ncbi:MAG TPA: hypothetical protein VJN21_13390 [Candidatus Acidoferrales bacterium]|nr:hypothetical protein [Candidatus Acidoferrales bacterium]
MRLSSRAVMSLCAIAAFAPGVWAQAGTVPARHTTSNPTNSSTNHFLWTEELDGSANSEGNFMELDSTVGRVFTPHIGLDAGIPIDFARSQVTSGTGRTSSGLGDAYLQLRFAFANPVLSYKSVVTGAVPTGSKSKGFSTGHATYDFTNHFDHDFGHWDPFAEAGVGNSIPERFIFQRPFASFGHVAHFQAGTGFQITDTLGVTVSAYDVAPWGSQTIFSREVGAGGPPVGVGRHGRVFQTANQTSGGASLSADNGFNSEADVSFGSVMDFSAGYSHSVHFGLNTFSYGVAFNVSEILRRTRGEK